MGTPDFGAPSRAETVGDLAQDHAGGRQSTRDTVSMNGLLHGRRGLIMGVANERSLAWGIAQQASAHGASLAFTYPNEAVGRRVRALVGEKNGHLLLSCDVSSDESIDGAFQLLAERWADQPLDFVVHAVSYSDKDELDDPFLRTSRRNFAFAYGHCPAGGAADDPRRVPAYPVLSGG
jgi:NAD(P)-dependent dehydrogenase (short-subunit alcohol dehydrogenase family)